MATLVEILVADLGDATCKSPHLFVCMHWALIVMKLNYLRFELLAMISTSTNPITTPRRTHRRPSRRIFGGKSYRSYTYRRILRSLLWTLKNVATLAL
jgi:hypothetical protein